MKNHSAKHFLITFSNLQYYPYMNVCLLQRNADLSVEIFGLLAKNRLFTTRIIVLLTVTLKRTGTIWFIFASKKTRLSLEHANPCASLYVNAHGG